MTKHRMAAVDAQFYWMSAKIPNDQFLLYAFASQPADLAKAIGEIHARARACPDLKMRVDDGCALTYPTWVPTDIEPDQVICHELTDNTWDACLDAVVRLADHQLNIRKMPWRLHVFTGVRNIPIAETGAVAVMQVAHALGDGARSAAMAAWLFGRAEPVPAVTPQPRGCLPRRAVEAARTHNQLVQDTRCGRLAPPVGSRPPLVTNVRPHGARSMRTLLRNRSQLRGPTVTIAVLSAVSTALSDHLGGNANTLGAEVPMAKPGVRQAHNHFGNVVVGLYPELTPAARAERIATDLANGRRRMKHPAARAADRAFAAVPPPLLRWGVARFDPNAQPAQVAGNTVVSSVHRGAADLHFGGAPVVLTAGYPALSPAMGLTHGVHGLGDTIAISVHAAESAIADIDAYLQRLDAAL
jgi:hypothetical protein